MDIRYGELERKLNTQFTHPMFSTRHTTPLVQSDWAIDKSSVNMWLNVFIYLFFAAGLWICLRTKTPSLPKWRT